MKQLNYHKQQGVTLLVAMIMLLILTMVGVSTMKDATMQERMSANNQQASLARANAHSALIAAEEYLESLPIEDEQDVMDQFIPEDGLYIPLKRLAESQAAEPTADMTQPDNWTADNSIEVDTKVDGFKDPRFFIEYIGRLNSDPEASIDDEDSEKSTKFPLVFRITAIGYGSFVDNAAIIQGIYSTQQGFNN